MNHRHKRWGVVFSHLHGEVGLDTGMTQGHALKRLKALKEEKNSYLDWADLIYVPKKGN